jgi:hypothetical protein
MLRLAPRTPSPIGAGLPLLFGALVSTGVSILLWSALWAGLSMLR